MAERTQRVLVGELVPRSREPLAPGSPAPRPSTDKAVAYAKKCTSLAVSGIVEYWSEFINPGPWVCVKFKLQPWSFPGEWRSLRNVRIRPHAKSSVMWFPFSRPVYSCPRLGNFPRLGSSKLPFLPSGAPRRSGNPWQKPSSHPDSMVTPCPHSSETRRQR